MKDGDTKIEKEKRTAKGIAKCAIDQQIRHLHYKQCLFDNKMTVNDMNLIRSQNHVLYVNNVRKIGLCNFDDKRFGKMRFMDFLMDIIKFQIFKNGVMCIFDML